MSSAMQQQDCYKVEVLYLLNPHLIWVEVRDPAIVFDDNEIKFEQIGIYGMLPLEKKIASDKEATAVQRCVEWVPEAAARIWEFLEGEEDVFFSPLHLDRRSSIFDDDVHKFGDLVVKKRNGKERSIRKVLKNTGFATFDVCVFHQYLSLGKINTKLSNIDTHNVIKELENYFIRKKVPKNKWEDPIKRQTSVFRVSCDLDEPLTATNLDEHNKHIKAILDGKNKDLELYKGADEPSAGKGSTRRGKEKKKSALEKKLEGMKNRKTKNCSSDSDTTENINNEHLQGFEDAKMLEANAAPYTKKIHSKSDTLKAQILSKVMRKAAKKVSKQDKLVNRLRSESREKRESETSDPLNATNESLSNSGQASTIISNNASEQEDIVNKDSNIEETNCESDEKQSFKTDEIPTTPSKPVQNILDKNDNHIANCYESQQNGSNEMPSTKPEQESSVKINETVVDRSLKEDKPRTRVPNNVGYHHRRSTRGKSNKKGGKASKFQSRDSTSHTKRGARNRSKSPFQKLAYPSRITIREVDPRNCRRVPDLPDNCKARATNPVSERMVKKLMDTFKLTESKHSEIIQNAIRKCTDGGKNNSEAIATLIDCRNKIIEDIKEQHLKDLDTVNLDMPLMETLSKIMSQEQATKQNANNGTNKIANGPPGIDISTLSRVPPVVLYDEELANSKNQTAGVILNTNSDTTADGNFSASGPSCSGSGCSNKVPENGEAQEKDIKIKRNKIRKENDISSSSSSMWEKRLKLHKEISKSKRCASHISDNTMKELSNPEEKTPPKNFAMLNVDEDSDDSISDIVEKLGIGYNSFTPNTCKNNKTSEYSPLARSVKANPFENYDVGLSVFINKPVIPIVMVHSKMNKDFLSISRLTDIHFSDHIRSVLNNLYIYHPTLLQSIAWNAILRGYSVYMIGSTLSGKTIGYLSAVCRHVTDYHQSDTICEGDGPFCIVVCATSHAVTEVERIAKMLLGCEEKVISCHYGYDEVAIATSLLNGCDLLVTTAPSLLRLLQMPNYGLDLRRLITFVLDDCERLSEIYSNEIKFCLHKVRESLQTREDGGLPVQYVIASRIWCDFMEFLAKKTPDSVVCIGAFQECVLYAKANMSVSYVKNNGKLHRLLEFLKDVDPSKRTVVVCDSDEEVDYLNRALQNRTYFISATDSTMTVEDLLNLTKLWRQPREPLMAPVLICCDEDLSEMNVVDANYLVQYSMPSQYSTFCRRFSTLNKSYPSIFKAANNSHIKILILLDEHNVEQLPKIVHFVKRCTNSVPDYLDDICAAIIAENDAKEAENFVPLCTSLMSYGACQDFYNCHSRHTILKDYDNLKKWMPISGIVTFRILHYHSATCYSAKLIGNFEAGTHFKYPSTYSHMSLTMGMHYAKQANRIAFGTPQVGDVCAVALSNELFCRAKVLKVGDEIGNGNTRTILVNLLDEELIETTIDTNLYHLPDDFKREETYVVQVRLANIQPRDKDLVFSQLAIDQIKEAISVKKNVYMKGRIVLTVGNCILVDTLEACQDLKTLKETVVIYNVKRELLDKHAESNPDHLPKIEELCRRAKLKVKPTEKKENESRSPVKVKPDINWAHFEEEMAMVGFGAVKSPTTLFVRLTKFEDGMKILLTDIQKHVTNSTDRFQDFEKGNIVLAEYPDDCLFERARIDEIGDKNIKCFFVDQGKWRQITKDKIKSISNTLLTQMPFQAIECRLVGIQPPGEQWTDFAINWLFDRCSESVTDASKQLFVKYYTKEPAQYTGGHKYGVAVFDTCGNEDLVLNQLMIDLNLAKEINDEIKYLELGKCKNEIEVKCEEVEDDDDSWEDISKYSTSSDSTPNKKIVQPLRSITLIGTNDDSNGSGKWNINVTEYVVHTFKPLIEASTQIVNTNVQGIENNKTEIKEEIDKDSLSENINNCTSQLQEVKIKSDSSKELDSDDLSSPETAQSTTETSGKDEEVVPLNEYQTRKPKLIWRQTRASVTIKIQLIGADSYDLQIHDRALTFVATVNDTNFGFEFELYGVIDKKTALHSNKGQYILVKLNKIMHKNWLTLTKDGGIRKWIVYDVDSVDTSSGEEEVPNDNLCKKHKKRQH